MKTEDIFDIIKLMLEKDPTLSIEVLPDNFSAEWPTHFKASVGSGVGLLEGWEAYKKLHEIKHPMYFNEESFKSHKKFNINVVEGKTHGTYPDQIKST